MMTHNMERKPAGPADAQALVQASEKLLLTAQGTVGLTESAPFELSEFVRTYREWITLERGELGTQQEQVDQWQMLVHCMINAATIGEAIDQFLRFAPVVWGQRSPGGLRDEGDLCALLFKEPHRDGPEGLVAAIWMLSLIQSTLEFLGSSRLSGVSGRVIHLACLPKGVARLLFDAPIAYGTGEVALVIPRRHLRRPVSARPTDLPRFFRELLPLTLGAARTAPDVQAMVSGLIRDQKQGPEFRETDRGLVAAMLGMSEATMRRRLGLEGTTFRQVRDATFSELAKEWLQNGGATVATVASRLGFSDTFAFRRFFVRANGVAPSHYRVTRQAETDPHGIR